MKATYFAAAAAVALAGMSGTAHAAFTFEDLGRPGSDLVDFPAPDAVSNTVNTGVFGTSGTRKSPYQDALGAPLGTPPTPFGDTATYTAVQEDSSATYNLTGSFLEILWGSPDDLGLNSDPLQSRNFIQFFNSGSPLGTVTAADLKAARDDTNNSVAFDDASFSSDGPGGADGFAWVKISLDNGQFDSFTLFNDGPNAFEVDGVVTPLPAAAWLMIGGLGAVGAYARRARKAAPTA